MKVLVLGATGGTGAEVVREAIAAGHDVTAFARSPEKLRGDANAIRIVSGDLLDAGNLSAVIRGQDAVLSAFGPRLPVKKEDEDLLHRFANVLVPCMQGAGVRRLIVESAAFLFKNAIIPPAYVVGRLFFSKVVRDQEAMEHVIQESDLAWTIVRPPRLTDNRNAKDIRIQYGRLPLFAFSISRAKVARAFMSLLSREDSVRQIVGVSE